MFYKKCVLKNFTNFTRKHLCRSLFYNQVAGLNPEACNFIKNETTTLVVSCESCKIFKNTYTFFKGCFRVIASVNISNQGVVLCFNSTFAQYSQSNQCLPNSIDSPLEGKQTGIEFRRNI